MKPQPPLGNESDKPFYTLHYTFKPQRITD